MQILQHLPGWDIVVAFQRNIVDSAQYLTLYISLLYSIYFLGWDIVVAFLKNISKKLYSIYINMGQNNALSTTTYLWSIWAIMTYNRKSSIGKGGIKGLTNSSKCKECALETFIEKELLKPEIFTGVSIIFSAGFMLCIPGIMSWPRTCSV